MIDTEKHTSKSRETIPLNGNNFLQIKRLIIICIHANYRYISVEDIENKRDIQKKIVMVLQYFPIKGRHSASSL
jgi:hypothetical protein